MCGLAPVNSITVAPRTRAGSARQMSLPRRAVNLQTRESAYRSGPAERSAAPPIGLPRWRGRPIWTLDADQIGQSVSFRQRQSDVKLSFGTRNIEGVRGSSSVLAFVSRGRGAGRVHGVAVRWVTVR